MSWVIILIVAPFIIGMVGVVAQRLVLGPKAKYPRELVSTGKTCTAFVGWRRIYYTTVPLHALLAGALIGGIGYPLDVPTPEVFGSGLAGATIAYTFSGAVSIVAYDALVQTVKRWVNTIVPGSGPGPYSGT